MESAYQKLKNNDDIMDPEVIAYGEKKNEKIRKKNEKSCSICC